MFTVACIVVVGLSAWSSRPTAMSADRVAATSATPAAGKSLSPPLRWMTTCPLRVAPGGVTHGWTSTRSPAAVYATAVE